jgi:hypothetical protein
MKHFVDESNQIYAYEDDVPDEGIQPGLTAISDTDLVRLEAFKKAASEAAQDLLPNPIRFIDAFKATLGGIVGANTLARAYPLFYPALQARNWEDVAALIIEAHKDKAFSEEQYSELKNLAETNHIPIILP